MGVRGARDTPGAGEGQGRVCFGALRWYEERLSVHDPPGASKGGGTLGGHVGLGVDAWGVVWVSAECMILLGWVEGQDVGGQGGAG